MARRAPQSVSPFAGAVVNALESSLPTRPSDPVHAPDTCARGHDISRQRINGYKLHTVIWRTTSEMAQGESSVESTLLHLFKSIELQDSICEKICSFEDEKEIEDFIPDLWPRASCQRRYRCPS